MKKIIILTLLFFSIQWTQGLTDKHTISKTAFAANLVGYFMQNGTEYAVYAYIPDTNIVKVTAGSYTSPTQSGYWYDYGILTIYVYFVDINGNPSSYNGPLHQ